MVWSACSRDIFWAKQSAAEYYRPTFLVSEASSIIGAGLGAKQAGYSARACHYPTDRSLAALAPVVGLSYHPN